MSWIDDLNSMPDAGTTYRYAPPVRQQPKKKTGRGGTLTSLISEGGALGGAAAGAALGSVVPVLGTAIGGALGGALGAFGGRVAENKVRDDRIGLGDAATEATLTGVLGAPIRSLKYGVNAVKASRGGANLSDALAAGANAADKKIIKQSGATVSKDAAKTSTKGKLNDLANQALTSQYGTIGKPVARKTNPEQTFGTLASYGLTKPDDVERIASAVTGPDGILNKAVVQATGASKRVDVGNLRQTLSDALENNGVVGKEAKELTTMFDAQMKRLLGGPQGSLSASADPSDVLDVMKAFERRIAQKTGKGGNYRLATDATTNQANALRLVVDELQGRLESGADIKKVLTPRLRESLVALNPGNKEWQTFVDKNVMNAKSIKELRSSQSPFVNARQIIDEADMNSMTFGGRLPNSPGGIRDAVVGAITGPAKAPAARASANVLKTVSNMTDSIPRVPSSPQITGTRIGAQGQVAEGLLSALTTPQAAVQTDTNEFFDPTGIQQDVQALPPSGVNAPASIFDPANIQQNVMTLLANGASVDDVTKYIGLAQALSEISGQGDSGLNSTTASQVASSANATNTLDQLEGLFNTAGGGAGKVGGSIKNALSGAGLAGDVQTYNDLSASSVSQLARALNGGGQVSDADAAVVIKALPRITDSAEVATRKFAALRQRLQAARQNTLFYNDASLDSELSGI